MNLNSGRTFVNYNEFLNRNCCKENPKAKWNEERREIYSI